MPFNETLALNQALMQIQSAKEVDDVSVKKASATLVTYTIKSKDRLTTRETVKGQLISAGFPKNKVLQTLVSSESSMEVVEAKPGKTKYRFVFKPTRGGMSQTTLNASITELFPCIAFLTGIKARSVKNNRDFYNKIIANNNPSLPCYVNARDAAAGREFIEKAENGKFDEKVRNAINVLRWIEGVNRAHPIANVFWGYRAKPRGVRTNHPGDIFLQFQNGQMLGVSLKAGGATTDEPKLNTYVKPIYDFYGKSREYDQLKEKLWPQYMQVFGVTEDDKKKWGTKALAMKTYDFEQINPKAYDALYDQNLAIIKQELANLLNSDMQKTKRWLLENLTNQDRDVPLVVVKTTQMTARRDKSSDVLTEALASVSSIMASATPKTGSSKQGWYIALSDGSKLQLEFTTRTNKVGAMHKMGQFANLAVKFNKVKKV
tara:strand:+ start:32 stop:1327 length:1296 start_codon:yes stop_codon:yes gene_type:complete